MEEEKEILEEAEKVEEPAPESETPADAGELGDKAPEAIEQEEPEPQPEPQEEEKSLPQSVVNKLVGQARSEGHKKGYEQAKAEFLEKYGVDDEDEMERIFIDGSRYGELSSRYGESSESVKSLRAENAMLKKGILPERQMDVKAILSANGLEVTEESIDSLLPTHPEWKAAEKPAEPAAPVKPMGLEPRPRPEEKKDDDAEYQEFMKGF